MTEWCSFKKVVGYLLKSIKLIQNIPLPTLPFNYLCN
jgi:hypothetical protein